MIQTQNIQVNGRGELVIQTAEAYQALLSSLELHDSAAGIARGLQDIDDGRASTLDDFDRRMKARLKIR